jgi:hypothetical protein
MQVAARAHLAWFIGDGAGARARFAAVVPHLAGVRVTAVTVGPSGAPVVGVDAAVELPWAGHLSAAGRTPSRHRTAARLRAWIAADRPDVLVVDGGLQIASAARSAGVPVIVVRRPGSGPAAVSSVVEPLVAGELTPYPVLLEPDDTPRWSRERTVHAGLLSRYAGRRPHRGAGRRAIGVAADARVVSVLCGRDGLGGAADLAAAAAATPDWTWVTVGRCGTPATGVPANLHRLGWRDDPWPALEAADVVIASGALSVVAEVASARRPLLVVPRPRRTDDEVHGRLLADLGAATTVPGWPPPAAWPRLLASVAATDPAPLAALDDGRGAARAADWLTAWASSPPLGAPSSRAVAAPTATRSRFSEELVLDLTRASADRGR